ncbi:MAG TPA: hypothetical protein VLZ81_09805, partial [Blastocatellia bacterium]|nr:hypothetical protein [Blastocatellia bacterium]
MTEQQSGIPSQADHDEQHPPPSSETPLPRQPESPIQAFLRGIFFGPYELRAGWRLCIFILLLVFLFVILTVIGEILAPVSPAPQAELKISAVEVALGVLTFGSVLAAAATMSKLERRPMRAYGLPARGAFGGRFWLGMIWGFSALTVLLLVMHFLGGFNFGHPVLHGREILVYGVLWLLSFIATGFFEEYLVRGYPQFTLTT